MITKFQTFLFLALILAIAILINACGNGSKKTDDFDVDEIAGKTEYVSAELADIYRNDHYLENTAGTSADETSDLSASDTTEVAREIEEADIIKVHDDHLFLLNSHKGLIICNISEPDTPYISSSLKISGTPVEMYTRNATAYILSKNSYYNGCSTAINSTGAIAPDSNLYEIDISDKANPTILSTSKLKGTITESRLVESILYAVTTSGSYSQSSGYTGTTHISSFNTTIPAQLTPVDTMTFNNGTNYIHVTDSAIFSVKNNWKNRNDSTEITYIDISNPGGLIELRGNVSIRGIVEDKFKLDSYNGYLRVCSYDRYQRESLLHVLSHDNPDKIVITGELTIIKNERLYATRFDGNTAYIVTFRTIDPLWVVNLSDPASPEISGELEVPGWSTHIEVRGNRLIALGVDNSSGSSKVAVSYFNVENPENPTLIKRLSFGEDDGWSFSNGYYDEKSFKIIDSPGLILLPYSTSSWTADNQYYSENRLQLISFSENEILARGYIAQNGNILRSASFKNRLFSISNDEMQVIDASNLDEPVISATLPLAQNIRKLVTISDTHGVLAVDKYDGSTQLQPVALSDPEKPAGEAIDVGYKVSDIFSTGSNVYVISNHSNPEYNKESSGTSNVTMYDFSSVVQPVKKGSIVIHGNNYSKFNNKTPSQINNNKSRVFQLSENIFLFSGTSSYNYRVYSELLLVDCMPYPYNDDDRKISIIDFSDSNNPFIASEFELQKKTYGGFVKNNIFYYSYMVDYEDITNGLDLKKYFLGRIDASDIDNPVEMTSINIPGIALHSDFTGTMFFTINACFNTNNNKTYTYNSVLLANNKAIGISSVSLKSNPNNFIAANGKTWFDSQWYEGIYSAVVVDTGKADRLKTYSLDISSPNCMKYIQWADGSNLITGANGILSIYNTQNISDIVLDKDLLTNGYIRGITNSGSTIYTILGYKGILVTDLLSD